MATVDLAEALAALVAEIADWSGATSRTAAARISQALRALHPQLADRPALRTWQGLLERWFAAADDAVAAPDQLIDAALASLAWAEGSEARTPGVEAAMQRVLADLGAPPGIAARLYAKLAAEAAAATPAGLGEQAAGSGLETKEVQTDPPAPAQPTATPEPALALDDTCERPSTDQGEAAAADGPIWLAPQERDMLLEAIHGELLPQLSSFSLLPHPRAPDDASMACPPPMNSATSVHDAGARQAEHAAARVGSAVTVRFTR